MGGALIMGDKVAGMAGAVAISAGTAEIKDKD